MLIRLFLVVVLVVVCLNLYRKFRHFFPSEADFDDPTKFTLAKSLIAKVSDFSVFLSGMFGASGTSTPFPCELIEENEETIYKHEKGCRGFHLGKQEYTNNGPDPMIVSDGSYDENDYDSLW